MAGLGRLALDTVQRGRDTNRRHTLVQLMRRYSLARPTVALDDREKGYLRAMAALIDDEVIALDRFRLFLAAFCWRDGQCVVSIPPTVATNALEPQARDLLRQLLALHLKPYDQFLAATASEIAIHRGNGQASGAAIKSLLTPDSAWGELKQGASSTYTLQPQDASLLVGYDGDELMPVYYGGDESLITIAGPGTGKSQVQVIPNLIGFPGSCFVLDVKGELWEQTAGHRAQHFGPVYRFAPTDPAGETHCYNPFDFISTDPHQTVVDCELAASQIIPPNSGGKDPFWDNRGRDFLFAFALVTALDEPSERRNLATVMEMLSIPVRFDSEDAYQRSPTPALVVRLKDLGRRFDIPALSQAAVVIESGQNDRMDGVFDAARRHLTIFSRSARLRRAMSRSEWTPLDLRRQPGTTVYLCLSGDDIDTYMPIVRLILQQHANLLLGSRRLPGVPPITFFLDEFPQLGRMESIQRLLDVGRGAGLRLWLFAQYLGQLRDIYDRRADGLIQACRVRSFMQPDNEAVALLRPQLGTVKQLFSGQDKPLAEDYHLMGEAFADKIVITARGHAPLLLGKRYAWQDFASETAVRAPAIHASHHPGVSYVR